MNAKETLKLLSKQWCTVNDIMKICNVGMNKAVEIRSELKERITKDGFLVPNNLIPTSVLNKAFNINLDYLERMSKNEEWHSFLMILNLKIFMLILDWQKRLADWQFNKRRSFICQ